MIKPTFTRAAATRAAASNDIGLGLVEHAVAELLERPDRLRSAPHRPQPTTTGQRSAREELSDGRSKEPVPLRILLLCSAFNGLTQRAWIELRAAGHDVTIRLASGDTATEVVLIDPDIIICPFLRDRVPTEVWRNYRTIIIHPGPPGDRGPSSLDWAISDNEDHWGVTALQAVEEMDAGPVWATQNFAMPTPTVRKSTVYNSIVTDIAIDLIHDAVAKAADSAFRPEAPETLVTSVRGRLRPTMRQADRALSWDDTTEDIVRRIYAADGSPGVQTDLCGVPVAVFDAHPGPVVPGTPGAVVGRSDEALLVRSGDGSVWIGHLRRMGDSGESASVKLPAAVALADVLGNVAEPSSQLSVQTSGRHDITYRRRGSVGVLRFDFYNGAMSTEQCTRLAVALRHAVGQDTRVLVLAGGTTFSNGIHLNVIEAAADPAAEAWRNINAIDGVCHQIISCTDKIVIASLQGNAGAGGVMMALGADRVVLRESVVLNPHYRTMGLYGSEYWTYVLPRRVGTDCAERLTEQCLPIGAHEAVEIGLADEVIPSISSSDFEHAVLDAAYDFAGSKRWARAVNDKRTTRAADERVKPLHAYREHELAEMRRDMFEDRHGFAASRREFVTKQRRLDTPAHLLGAPTNSRGELREHSASGVV